MDRKDFAIGLLSTTAVVLFVGLLILQSGQRSVMADGMSIAGAGYLMTVGAITQNDEDLVYVFHPASERLASYRFDSTQRQIRLVQGIDLSEVRNAAAARAASRMLRSPVP